jgi:hypothetical protein
MHILQLRQILHATSATIKVAGRDPVLPFEETFALASDLTEELE